MQPYVFTHNDVIGHLSDWSGFTGASSQDMLRKIKRSIDNAYRTLTHLKDWSIYAYRCRLNTNAMYNTGTIAYTHSTRTVTLTGGTLPSYTNLCTLRVGPVDYLIVNGSANIGAGTFKLSVNSNPGADLAAGTAYTLYQDMYAQPVNLRAMGTLKDCNRSRFLAYVTPNDMIASRQIYQTPTLPFRYTIRGDESYLGSCGIQLYPPPDQAYQYDYMGYRYPRPFTTPIPYTTGTVTTSGTTVTGTGTAWTAAMLGTIIRFSTTTTAPTGMYGSNPYYLQRRVTAINSATSLTIDLALDTDQTGVAYEISDPIDMDAGAMYTAFLRLCEYELGQLLNRDDVDRLAQQYTAAMMIARDGDNRSFDNKPGGLKYYQRVSDGTPLTDASS